jgi:putative intracellular protease/amidase
VLKDRTLTCYPAVGSEVKASGANFQQVGNEDVVVEGNLVSALPAACLTALAVSTRACAILGAAWPGARW